MYCQRSRISHSGHVVDTCTDLLRYLPRESLQIGAVTLFSAISQDDRNSHPSIAHSTVATSHRARLCFLSSALYPCVLSLCPHDPRVSLTGTTFCFLASDGTDRARNDLCLQPLVDVASGQLKKLKPYEDQLQHLSLHHLPAGRHTLGQRISSLPSSSKLQRHTQAIPLRTRG